MGPLLNRARSLFKIAREHIQNDDRYRFYPVYSVLLVFVFWSLIRWPFTDTFFRTLIEHRWMMILESMAHNGVLWLSLFLGVVGLVRRGWISKLISGFAIYHTVLFLHRIL